MGMTGNLIRVSNEQLQLFKEDSSKLEKLVYSEENYNAPWRIDLDKTWEAIHYLLCGSSLAETDTAMDNQSKLDGVIFNHQLIDEEQDLGYGPASYHTPAQVQTISSQLNNINIAELERNYKGENLDTAGVYPQIWSEEESKEYLFDNFKTLIVFYNEAVKNQEAVLSFIN